MGAGGGPVGVDGVGRGVVADLIQIELPEARDGIGHDGVAVGGVAPWLETAVQERAIRRMSPSTAAATSKEMGWRERVFWKVSSREMSSFTARPPTWVVRKALRGS